MENLAFTIPMLPPSTNRLWRYGRGRVFKNEKAEEFEWIAKKHLPKVKAPIAAPVELNLSFTFKKLCSRSDLDNRLKSCIDALVHLGILEDDNFVYKITCDKKTGDADCVTGFISLLNLPK